MPFRFRVLEERGTGAVGDYLTDPRNYQILPYPHDMLAQPDALKERLKAVETKIIQYCTNDLLIPSKQITYRATTLETLLKVIKESGENPYEKLLNGTLNVLPKGK